MNRFNYTADVNYPGTQVKSSYERRPVMPEVDQHPVGVSFLLSGAVFAGGACIVMFADLPLRWLWIAGLTAAIVFVAALMWRIGIQDTQLVMERETTVSLPDADIRPTITSGRRGEVIRRGNFTMTRAYWIRLYLLAQDGRRVTRDAVVDADAMPRELYHGDFDSVTAELRRVGLLDNDNRMTADWRVFHRDVVLTEPARGPFVRSSNTNEGNSSAGVGGVE